MPQDRLPLIPPASNANVDTGFGEWGVGTAHFSPDRLYRYRLSRVFDSTLPAVNFLMLNPSTADAFKLDPTVRRCMGFAKLWGMGTVEVTNIFAYRATNPKELYALVDPVGIDNDAAILAAANTAALVVCAWGTHGALVGRGLQVVTMLARAGVSVQVLKLTQAGHPMHPLYLAANTKPFVWQPSAS